MTVTEAINFLIDNDYEGHAIAELNRSLRNKLADEYAKNANLDSRIRAIKKINSENRNTKERRDGIAALCEEENT